MSDDMRLNIKAVIAGMTVFGGQELQATATMVSRDQTGALDHIP